MHLIVVTTTENLDFQNLSQNLAHFGFSLLILSILFNNIYSTEVITNLKVGQTFKSKSLIIDFQSIDKKNEKNFQAIIGKFKIKELDNETIILNPELASTAEQGK